MRRLLQSIISNPINLWLILSLNIKVALLRLRGIRTIVFNLHHDYFFDNFKLIYKELLQDSKVRVFFSYKKCNPMLSQYLRHNDVRNSDITNSDISPFVKFNLFVCAEVTGPDFPISILGTKNLQIYHGTGIYNLYEKREVLKRFHYHFAIGKQFRKLLHDIGANEKFGYHVYSVGYSKTDAVVNDLYSSDKIKSDYNIQDEKVILYAPHWKEDTSLHLYGVDIIDNLSSLGCKVLVKVHNYLYSKFSADNWREKLDIACSKYENVEFVDEADTQKFYQIADVMVTDVGTTAAMEFSLLKRPVLIANSDMWFKEKNEVEHENDLVDMSIGFNSLAELTHKLKLIIDDSESNEVIAQKKKQDELINKYFYNVGTATEHAVKSINQILNEG